MLNFKVRSEQAFFCLALVFAFWLLGIATGHISAGCFRKCTTHTCLLYGQNNIAYVIQNADTGASCIGTYQDSMVNTDYCTGTTNATFYKADQNSGTQQCPSAGNEYGTVTDDSKCATTGAFSATLPCCKNKCQPQSPP
jgi:hypothetical protein